MLKPRIIIRTGNKFVIDERKILPYMRKSKDLIMSAITVACEDFKRNPDTYGILSQEQKIEKLNNVVYDVLEKWGVYKG